MNKFGDVIDYPDSLKDFMGQSSIWAFGNAARTALVFPRIKLQDEWNRVRQRANYLSRRTCETFSYGKPYSVKRFVGLFLNNSEYALYFGRHEYGLFQEGLFVKTLEHSDEKRKGVERKIRFSIIALTPAPDSSDALIYLANADKYSQDELTTVIGIRLRSGKEPPVTIKPGHMCGHKVLSVKISEKDFQRLFRDNPEKPSFPPERPQELTT